MTELTLPHPDAATTIFNLEDFRVVETRRPVAGPAEVVWIKVRYFCDEQLCPRRTFCEATVQVPARARSTRRLHAALVAAVVSSGRAATETAAAHGVLWWLVQKALTTAATKLPDIDALRPRMLGIDEHRFRSVRFFKDTVTNK